MARPRACPRALRNQLGEVLLLRLLSLQWLVNQPSLVVAQAAEPSVAVAVAHWQAAEPSVVGDTFSTQYKPCHAPLDMHNTIEPLAINLRTRCGVTLGINFEAKGAQKF